MRENKDKLKIYRGRKATKVHTISEFEWNDCKRYFNFECAYCGLRYDDHFVKRNNIIIKSDFHKEHLDDKGPNDLSNCIPACKSCNSQKWAFGFDEWYNDNNKHFSEERLEKILKWINEDHKQYIIIK
ncbi:HNH endonuclease [Paenibacillus lactis]|uniref:HNH endonuclease n=1 Tax=Paenibacillus lactis TaxID=228574 RepID=UPI003D732DC5